MPAKKKSAAPDIEPLPPATEASLRKAGTAPAAPPRLSPSQQQIRDFELALHSFGQRRFPEALTRFEEAMRGPAPHVADKARSYIQVCARKMAGRELNLNSAEDYFNYGIERLNARDIEQARVQFSRAIALDPNAEHIFYAMAFSCGLAGDGDGAYENLKRAIELEPRNRILARQDPEFSSLAQKIPLLRTLLQTESKAPF